MPLRVGVAAHLVEHRALDRQDAPVGLVLRMRAVERVQGLLVAAVVRERTAIGTEDDTIVPIVDCRLLKHGRGLRPLSNGAQCLGVADGRHGVARIVAVPFAPGNKTLTLTGG